MPFSKLETIYLTKLLATREQNGPSILKMIRGSLESWLFLAGCAFLGFVAFLGADFPSLGFALVGFCAGAILRDFGWFRKSRRLWKIQKDVIDWARVEALLKEMKEKSSLTEAQK